MAQRRGSRQSGKALPGIPPEIWQYIFTYLSPPTLADLLRVNRRFNHLLSYSDTEQEEDVATIGALRPLSSQEIWESARRLYFPLLPKPLAGCSELAMWRLLLGKKCQACHREQSDHGTGHKANRVVWSLASRSCAKCLSEQTLAEYDVLYDYGSVVAQAVPFAFQNKDKEIVPTSTIQSQQSAVQPQFASRIFLRHDLAAISADLDSVRANSKDHFRTSIGKLICKKRERMQSAETWEAWEQAGSLPDLRELLVSLNRKEKSKLDAEIHAPKAKKFVGSECECLDSLIPTRNILVDLANAYNKGIQTIVLKAETGKKTPLQELLEKYADDFARDFRSKHSGIEEFNSPQFAADLILQVRRRFANESSQRKLGTLNTHELQLQDMKWVYEEKVRPNLPDRVRDGKELLFSCRGSDCKPKKYSFHGVISHFASMHTKEFSSGKTVVAWSSAAWPKDPPFKVQPHSQKQSNGQQTAQKGSTQTAKSSKQAQRPFSVPAPPPQGYLVSPGPHGHLPWTSGSSMYPGPPPMAEGIPPSLQGLGKHPVSPAYTGQSAFSGPVSQPLVLPAHSTLVGSHALQAPPYYPSIPTPVSNRTAWSLPQFSSSEPTFPPPSSQPNLANFHQCQMDEAAHIAFDTWTSLSRVKVIPPSVRMYVIIHQVVSQFQKRFSNEPNLDLFIECVNNHSMMRPMKDVNGLACKTCVVNDESHEGPQPLLFLPSSGGRKLFSFSSLLLHFQKVHVQQRRDWKTDMIELPENDRISGLKYATGMDAQALDIIAEILPDQLGYKPRAGVKRKSNSIDRPASRKTTSEAQMHYGPVLADQSRSEMHGLTTQHPPHLLSPESQGYQAVPRAFDILYEEPRHTQDDQYDPMRPTFIRFAQPDPAGMNLDRTPGDERQPAGFYVYGQHTGSPGMVSVGPHRAQNDAHSADASPKRIKLEPSEERSFPEIHRIPGNQVSEGPFRYYHSPPMGRPIYINPSGTFSEGPPYVDEPQDYVWIKRARPES